MKRTKFCPKCGRETEKFYDNLCKDCFLQKIKLIGLPEKIVVKHCKICGKFFSNGERRTSLERAVDDALSKVMRLNDIESATSRIDRNKIFSNVIVLSEGLRKEIEVDFKLIEKEIICKSCANMLSGYF